MSTDLNDRIPQIIARVDVLAEVERRGGVVVRHQGNVAECHCPCRDHPDDRPSFRVDTRAADVALLVAVRP